MKKLAIIVVAVLVVIGGFMIFDGNDASAPPNDTETNVTTLDFATIAGEASVGTAELLDVRTIEEYNTGYIDGALLWPLQDMQANKLPPVDKTQVVYVYCQGGNRSAQATQLLQQNGYNAVDLGGIQDVVDIGGTIIQP